MFRYMFRSNTNKSSAFQDPASVEGLEDVFSPARERHPQELATENESPSQEHSNIVRIAPQEKSAVGARLAPPTNDESTGATLNSTGATLNSTGATLNSTGATLNSTGATLNSTGATLNSTGATSNSTLKPYFQDLTLQQAAQKLNISQRTVQRRLKQGLLKGYKIPGPRGPEWRVVGEGLAATTYLYDGAPDTRNIPQLSANDTQLSANDSQAKNHIMPAQGMTNTEYEVLLGYYQQHLETLQDKLEAAMYRNGYLEAKLSGSASLLPDSSSKSAKALILEQHATQLATISQIGTNESAHSQTGKNEPAHSKGALALSQSGNHKSSLAQTDKREPISSQGWFKHFLNYLFTPRQK